MNNIPAAKIKMMKASIRCLVFGVLGLIPVIGLPFALAALWISGRIRLKERQFWNPARPYRICGVVCAAFGTVAWGFIFALIIYHAAVNA